MNVNARHPDYEENIAKVLRVQDIYEGIDSTTKYIYQLEREADASFTKRLQNATLKNFVKRAVEAFVGMIYRKHIEVTGLSDDMTVILNKIDKTNNLNRFSRDVTTKLILGGKVFLVADTQVDGSGLPYAIIYDRTQIINWRKDDAGKYTLVVIEEYIEEEINEFESEYVEQWRVYREDGNVEIYRKNDNDGISLVETIVTEFDYIPIIAIELDEIPPLYDIAKLTIKHTNRTSIKDKYLDICACPVPIIWGADIDDTPNGTKNVMVVGADEAFLFTGTKSECDFEWRELSGSAIDKLQEDLNVIEEDITTGIIRAATSDTTTIKTATQAYYEAAESANRVVVIANAVEQGLNELLVMLSDLGNITNEDEARIIVNKDFNAISGRADDLRLLWEVYLGGALSIETFLDSLSKYEAIDVGNVKDEISRIEKDKFEPKSRVQSNDNPTVENMDNRTQSMINNDSEE